MAQGSSVILWGSFRKEVVLLTHNNLFEIFDLSGASWMICVYYYKDEFII